MATVSVVVHYSRARGSNSSVEIDFFTEQPAEAKLNRASFRAYLGADETQIPLLLLVLPGQ